MNHLPLKVKVSTLNNYGCHLQYLRDDLVLYFCKNTELNNLYISNMKNII